MDTYLVRVSGCTPGTITTAGTVVELDRTDVDHYRVKFSTGEVRTMRTGQALSVLVDQTPHDCWDNAVAYMSGDGPLGHGWECGICGALLQVG